MKRCDVIALLDHILNLVGDKHAFAELLCAMYHTVTNSVDFVVALNATFHGISQDIQDSLHCAVMVNETEFKDSL